MFVIYTFWLVFCFWVYILKNITDPSIYLQKSTVRAEIVETEHIIWLEYEISSCNEDFLGRNRTQTYDISRHRSFEWPLTCIIQEIVFI